MNSYSALSELFNDVANTQLMRQEVDLLGIQYIKVGDLCFLHSYYERTTAHSANPLFQAAAQVHQIKKLSRGVELTIKALKDRYDHQAVELIRSLDANQAELSYSHLAPQYIAPIIHNEGWDNWSFAHALPPQERLAKRRARTKQLSQRLYGCLKKEDLTHKKILFLGCGDGDEIEVFLQMFDTNGTYILGIDQSAQAISNCNTIKAPAKSTQLSFQQMNFCDIGQLSNFDFDLIIAIGVFDRETLSFNAGQGLLRQMIKQLKFMQLLCRGYSFELFSSQDYRELGFDVIATCQPQLIYTRDHSFFYLLQKSSNSTINETSDLTDKVAEQSLHFWEGV